LDGLSFDSIGEVKANWLEKAFDEDEVFEVVKAPSPDNYSMAFFQACLEVLKEVFFCIFIKVINTYHFFFI
jgi:hypothetical protein